MGIMLHTQVIMITFAGITIASMIRISNDDYSNDDDTIYEDSGFEGSSNFITIFFFLIYFSISLCCTTLSVITDILVVIAQFVSSKIINHIAFRVLVCQVDSSNV